ncbi:hypothetical protein [Methanocella sp. MCL-LM]|uniref:hypothetical protein n=1 Tax=Methanocella sp. MCL-LM TaxID=3412035 RepID=UPI003C78AE24
MISDEIGADTLPVAFVATLLITAAIVGIAATGLGSVSPAIDAGSADVQAEALATDCRALLACAPRCLEDPGSPAGATKIAELSLPGSTEFFGLGTDAAGEEGSEGVIYYSVAGSKKAVVVDSGVSFRSRGDGSLSSVLKAEHVVLRGGRYVLEIEYACDGIGNRYLLVGQAGYR